MENRVITPRLLEGGPAAFERGFVELIDAARHAIHLRCFDWRDDEDRRAGRARRCSRAADRGVRVDIPQGPRRGGRVRVPGGGRSRASCTRRSRPSTRASRRGSLITVAPDAGARFAQRPSALASALFATPERHDQSHPKRSSITPKLYVFDDEGVIVVGGMGIGDDFRLPQRRLHCSSTARRRRRPRDYTDRNTTRAPFERVTRPPDFLLHRGQRPPQGGGGGCPMLPGSRLPEVRSARTSLTARDGVPRRPGLFTDALARRGGPRGSRVTLDDGGAREHPRRARSARPATPLLRAHRRARRTCAWCCTRDMIHSKVARRWTTAWWTSGRRTSRRSSHGIYDEVNLYAQDERLAAALEAAVERHVAEGERAGGRVTFNRFGAFIARSSLTSLATRGLRGGRTSGRGSRRASRWRGSPRRDDSPAGGGVREDATNRDVVESRARPRRNRGPVCRACSGRASPSSSRGGRSRAPRCCPRGLALPSAGRWRARSRCAATRGRRSAGAGRWPRRRARPPPAAAPRHRQVVAQRADRRDVAADLVGDGLRAVGADGERGGGDALEQVVEEGPRRCAACSRSSCRTCRGRPTRAR